MLTKQAVIVGLVGVNLILLAALIFAAYPPPAAYAQRAGASSGILAVTCQTDNDYDALYLLDLSGRRLHCFVPNRDQSGAVIYGGSRDLTLDFNR